jgi:uncharacterized protein (UPF0261 family)/ABC-type branched-subunit amino acid transport system ATPase component
MTEPILAIEDLHVHYGRAHALQGVSLTLDRGVLSVVGRNGMGKTTLCNTIMGLKPATSGRIRVAGQDIVGLAPNDIVGRGLGYVPQGRRVWPSLSVDEHLRLAAGGRRGVWTVERIYDTFPRLADRRRNGGAQLSGGEQQMLAIGRALLADPRLLVMDEPTEGLAPVIVDQVAQMLHTLAGEGAISVLLVEQNLGVAMDVADRVTIMVNGRIARTMPAEELARDLDLQRRLLGVGTGGGDAEPVAEAAPLGLPPEDEGVVVYRIRRAEPDADAAPEQAIVDQALPNRWGGYSAPEPAAAAAPAPEPDAPPPISLAAVTGRAAYVVGTFDTKGRELGFLESCIEKLGLKVVTVDLSTTRRPSTADIGPLEVARHHPKGADAVFTGDRGSAVTAMAQAFERFILTRRDLGGIVSAAGSGGTSLATPAMQALPVGVPKVMVSTVASGDVKRYVGPADICMMYAVTDVQGINRISERVLSNAAHALAGMIAWRRAEVADRKPAIGLTMFGLTTPCVQAVTAALEATHDCIVFHATGTGGQSMEKLADSGLLSGVIDVTTTEVPDMLVGGVFPATEDRFGAIIRTRIPYVGSCGAIDMVNFNAKETVPAAFRNRTLYVHNPNVTLMRTSPEECDRIGRWIGERLNRMEGPVRFLLPEGGLSLLDRPGQPFWSPDADRALFKALEETVRPGPNRRLVRLPHNLNDPEFAAALVANFLEIAAPAAAGASYAPYSARRHS